VKSASNIDVQSAALDLADVQLALARWYDFLDWSALSEHAREASLRGTPVWLFESAVESVITGDVDTLASRLHERPELVSARSTRITSFDPPVHAATLLHYVAANAVEAYRKTPSYAVQIVKLLLEAGARADMYGQPCTVMCMLVSSCRPAEAGVQVALVNTLLDFGASIEGDSRWGSPLIDRARVWLSRRRRGAGPTWSQSR